MFTPTARLDARNAERFRTEPGYLLLLLLDEAVRRTAAGRPLSGTVCVGICGQTEVIWWTAIGSRRGETRWGPEPTWAADVLLLLGERDARHILEHGALPSPPTLAEFSGDPALLEELLGRTTSQTTLMRLRVTQRGE